MHIFKRFIDRCTFHDTITRKSKARNRRVVSRRTVWGFLTMSVDAPLIFSHGEEKDSVYDGSYAPPIVPRERRDIDFANLPEDPVEREKTLLKWSEQLRAWQESLEGRSTGVASEEQRQPNWPFSRIAFWKQDIQNDITSSIGKRVAKQLYWSWFAYVLISLFNAIAISIVRGITGIGTSDIGWAFALLFFFGSICYFALYRLIYTSLRKMRKVSIFLTSEFFAVSCFFLFLR